MLKRIIEDMQLLPFGWTGKRTNYSNVYIAPNLVAAKEFLQGGNKRIKAHAEALEKDIIIQYVNENNTVEELKRFCCSLSDRNSSKQTNKIESKKTMDISNNTLLNLDENVKPNISSDFIQIASFIQRETNKGNSCRINDMEKDVYYYMLKWQPIATDKGDKLEIDKSDVMDDAEWLKIDPKRHWDPSFEPGNHNYYEELKSRLLKEGYLPGFKYHILQPSGKLSQCSTDYYLIVYMNKLCRLAVQNPNNRTIINHDTKYMRLK